jgi:uncharacterized protein
VVDACGGGGEAPCFAHLLDGGPPPGAPCWIVTAPPDPAAARAFYGGLFGWRFAGDIATLGGRAVAGIAAPHTRALRAGWTTYVTVGDAAAVAGAVADHGGRVLADPAAVGDSGRAALVADPAGAAFGLWEPLRLRGAEAVNEPGTWTASSLATPDPAGAAAFYGAVFGGDATDGVAWLAPGDGAARWDVTFAVDDADGAAGRAERLGGTVVTPPFDADAVRLAVVRDPAGAELTLSHHRGR